MKVLVKNDSKISFIVGSLRNSGFAPGKIRSVLWLYIKGDKWTQVTIKVFVSYSVTICGVTTHMYYKCQSNPDSYMCTHLNVDIKGPVCAEEYET